MNTIKTTYMRLAKARKQKLKQAIEQFLLTNHNTVKGITNTKTPSQLLNNTNYTDLTVGDYYNQNLK